MANPNGQPKKEPGDVRGRQEHHSINYGGARNTAGRTISMRSRNKLNKEIIQRTLESPEEHPFEIIKKAYLDTSLSIRERAYFAAQALPYCMPKPQAVKQGEYDPLAGKTFAEKQAMLESALQRLQEMTVG